MKVTNVAAALFLSSSALFVLAGEGGERFSQKDWYLQKVDFRFPKIEEAIKKGEVEKAKGLLHKAFEDGYRKGRKKSKEVAGRVLADRYEAGYERGLSDCLVIARDEHKSAEEYKKRIKEEYEKSFEQVSGSMIEAMAEGEKNSEAKVSRIKNCGNFFLNENKKLKQQLKELKEELEKWKGLSRLCVDKYDSLKKENKNLRMKLKQRSQ